MHVLSDELAPLSWDSALGLAQHSRRLGAPVAAAELVEQTAVETWAARCSLLRGHRPVLLHYRCLADICSIATNLEMISPKVVFLALIKLGSKLVRLALVVEAGMCVTRVMIVCLCR